jgi:hypothetical protein
MLLIVPLLPCQPPTSPKEDPIRRGPILLLYPIMGLQLCIIQNCERYELAQCGHEL